VFFESQAQQINPVPDYVFRNQMSVGRNAVTDTAAYISIGPRYGANKGMMPPIVSDTAAITGVKRNGLLIFSVQRNNFQYWDSINSRWTSVTANVDTTVISTRAWRKKGDDSLGALIALKVNISDTATMLNPYTRGSGTTNRVAKFTASGRVGNSSIYDSAANPTIVIGAAQHIGIGTATSAWSGFTNVMQFRHGGHIAVADNSFLQLGTNAYYDGSDYRRVNNGFSSRYLQNDGAFFWLNAGNSTAGSTISYSERMRMTNDGELLINTTTDVGDYRLQVNGNANFRDDVLIDTNLRVNRHIALDQTLAAWSLGNAIQGPQGATLFLAGGGVQSLANVYYDGSYKYTTSNPGAAMFLLQSGITFATYGSGTANGSLTGANEMVYAGGELRVGISDQGTFKLQVADKSYFGDEVQIASTTDLGNYKLQVTGDAILTGSITTGAPTSGTAAAWKLGTKVATSVQLDTGNYIEVEVGGTFYRLAIVTPL
jgi:hypothetical protein